MSVKSSRAAAWTQEASTLLASPVQATVRPLIGPRCSSKVMTSAMIWQGWVVLVRPLITGIDGVLGEFRHHRVVEGADHDGVDIAGQDPRRVGDGLAAAELHLLAGEHQRLAAELAHADIEGDAGAGRGLVEDHRQHLAVERALLGAARPCGACALMAEPTSRTRRSSRAGEIAEIEEVAGLVIRRLPAGRRPAAGFERGAGGLDAARRPRAISASVMISGGRRRATLSPAADQDAASAPRAAATNSVFGTMSLHAHHQALAAHRPR